MKRLVAGVVAVGVTIAMAVTAPAATAAPAAAAAAGTSAAGAPGVGTITWGDCSDPTLQSFGAVCGFLSVPLDYDHPGGTKIKLAVSMVRHTVPASKYQGVMLTNPGGPGGSGLIYSILGAYVPNNAGAAYDWIGFDPRGIGASIPSLHCQPYYFHGNRPAYVPTTAALEATWLKRSESYADSCGRNGGDLLAHLKTIDSARDMDSIRVALHRSQINYFGFSYGTYLGQVYATMFPTHMRRMVMDSNVDPRRVWYQANLDQDIAFERNMKIWFGWLAQYDSVYHLGNTEAKVEKLFYRQQAELYQHPAKGLVGGDEWNDIFLGAGYYQLTWLELAGVFAGWVHGHDATTLVAEFRGTDGPGDDNGYAMYDAVQCTDVQWPQSWATWQKDNWATYKKAPFETWSNAWYNAPCLFWPAKAGTPVKIDGSNVAPALLIDETLDAATPFTGSLEVRRLFPNSVLLAEPGGTSHADSLFGNECVDGTIARYLATGALPSRKPGVNRADTYCAPLPVPVPDGAVATAASASAKATATATSGPSRALLVRLLLAAQRH